MGSRETRVSLCVQDGCFSLVAAEADPGTRICVQTVPLGGEPRKHGQRNGDVIQEGKAAYKGVVIMPAGYPRGQPELIPLETLGHGGSTLQLSPPTREGLGHLSTDSPPAIVEGTPGGVVAVPSKQPLQSRGECKEDSP